MEPLLPIGIHLPQRGNRTLLHDLHRQLRSAIVEGRLRPGLRLPSTRSIAETYGVSRNTAVAAYELLLSEGYVVARRGSGTAAATSLSKAPGSSATRRARSSRLQRVVPIWRSMRVVSNENAALRLPSSDASIEVEALRQRIGIRALTAFASRRSSPAGLVFGFGAISDTDIVGGVASLRRLLASSTASR
jgi:DNA-binding transcriptional MocR family regulator